MAAPADSTVKGFIKGTGKSSTGANGGLGNSNGGRKGAKSKKRGEKGGDDGDEHGYGRRRRVPKREEWNKFDKEWEQLVGIADTEPIQNVVEEVVEVEEE